MKLDILAFGAHPDDVELGCSGTIAKEISLDLILRGECPVDIRNETKRSEKHKK